MTNDDHYAANLRVTLTTLDRLSETHPDAREIEAVIEIVTNELGDAE